VSYAIATPGRLAPLFTNIAGLTLQLIWTGTFLAFSTGETHQRIRLRALLVVALMGCVVVVAFVAIPATGLDGFLPTDDSATSDFLGIAASVFNTGMYGAPLEVSGSC